MAKGNSPWKRPSAGSRPRVAPHNALWLVVFAAAFGLVYFSQFADRPLLTLPQIGERVTGTSFAACGVVRRNNCVIDGDTFKFNGVSIRLADIDAPETHPPRCESEAKLGDATTRRLRELLNDGPFTLRTQGEDEDRYGRKLRIVARQGRSIGAMLVREGLAREWTGLRMSWC